MVPCATPSTHTAYCPAGTPASVTTKVAEQSAFTFKAAVASGNVPRATLPVGGRVTAVVNRRGRAGGTRGAPGDGGGPGNIPAKATGAEQAAACMIWAGGARGGGDANVIPPSLPAPIDSTGKVPWATPPAHTV